MHQDVLAFWFDEIDPDMWWESDPAFDDQIRQRFGDCLMRAARCELVGWRGSARGRLAEIIVLDQFSRNLYRHTSAAFAQDPLALALAQEAIDRGVLDDLDQDQRTFLLMPLHHSESVVIHQHAAALFQQYTSRGTHDYELTQKAIIDRFGRYPHRNEILGRVSTPEEIAFLAP